MERNKNSENTVIKIKEETPDDHINEPQDINVSTSSSSVFAASFIETNNKTLKYKCPMCNKKFKNKGKVEKHVNSHITIHSIYTNGDFKCLKCNCYFENLDNYQLHAETHKKIRGRPRKASVSSDDDVIKPFVCDKCAKSFKRKQQLLNHNLVHLNIKPFECFHCDKSFKLKQQLQNHLKIHEDIRPFTCESCEKSFKFKQQLENHCKTHTDIRPFKCILCEKAFKFKQQLQMHFRVHDGLRLFKCDSCDKAFKLKQQLQFHMKVHSDERPFQCSVCEKSFKLKQQLKTHYKVHGKHFIDSKILEPNINLDMKESDILSIGDGVEDEDLTNNETNIFEPNINLQMKTSDTTSIENSFNKNENIDKNKKLDNECKDNSLEISNTTQNKSSFLKYKSQENHYELISHNVKLRNTEDKKILDNISTSSRTVTCKTQISNTESKNHIGSDEITKPENVDNSLNTAKENNCNPILEGTTRIKNETKASNFEKLSEALTWLEEAGRNLNT